MRSLRMSLAAAGLLGIAPTLAGAQNLPPVKSLLELPQSIKGVEYETPTGTAVAACKVELVYDAAKKHAIGYALRDGQGKLLRKFVDNNGNGKMDQWSYFQDGFEVYRESDGNDDGSPDEARWMNMAGTRVAAIAGGKIKSWKRLSAEEASKVFVQALVAGDLALLDTVFARPEELEAAGLPRAELDRVAQAAGKRLEQINALRKGLVGWTDRTVWSRLDGMMPHLIPADPAAGLASDVTLYENAVIFAAPPNGQGNVAKMAFLQAPDMIKIGETWKFLEVPRAVDPEKPVIAGDGGLRAVLAGADRPGGRADMSPEMDAALKALAAYTQENAKLLATGDKKDVARYHVDMIQPLRNVVKVARSAEDKLVYNKQIADSLAAAYQTGFYPKGAEFIDALIAEGSKIASYAAFRKLSAVFALNNEEKPGEALANQKKWMADLKTFADAYPEAEETPDALFQLAQGYEFNAEEEDARKFYGAIAQNFPKSEAAKKATGALRRLDLVGKSIALHGPTLEGQEVDADQFKGKTLLVVFWATWAEPVKRDLPELAKLYQKHRDKGLAIVGVNVDNERKDVEAFLKATPLPWPQIFEKDGMDSRLATEYGIISLPTMILVDPKGTVISRSIRSAAELERQLDKTLGDKGDGVALGVRERAASRGR